MKSKRIKWLDFSKGFTICLVVLAHCSSELFQPQFDSDFYVKLLYYILFLVIMPVFFSISGFLYKKIITMKSYLILIYKKSISLLLPYLIISTITTIGKKLMGYNVPISYCVIGFNYYSALWFLPALFLIFIVIGLLDLVHIRRYIQFLSFVSIIILQHDFYITSTRAIWYHLIIYMTFSYAIFFYLGIFIRKYLIKILYNYIYIIVVFGILFFIVAVKIQLHFTSLLYSSDNVSLVTIFSKIIGVFVLFALSIIMVRHKIFTLFLRYGRYTLIIYLLNHPMITLVGTFIRKSSYVRDLHFYIYICLVFLISLILLFYICKLSNENSIINFIFYPRSYINRLIIKTSWGKKIFHE